MSKAKYEHDRPYIPADVRRSVEVEAGHECSVKTCTEHTYLEIHHINENREDNRVENLILLCDKHHKMAHGGVIDRKALREYKQLLNQNYVHELRARIENLEALIVESSRLEKMPSQEQPAEGPEGLPKKQSVPRYQITGYALEQVALSKLENELGIYFERQVSLRKSGSVLELDALSQNDDLEQDLIVEVKWLRKRYLDGPVWIQKLEQRIHVYELITGRRAKGILLFAVPKDSMKEVSSLHYTSQALAESASPIDVRIYTYQELGFNPGPISAGLLSPIPNEAEGDA